MPEGGLLTVGVELDDEDPASALVVVQDTGSGISPEDLEKIFDPFFTTKERGSGLGLSIVFRIVDAGGGHIRVESNPGQGSKFTVFLPLVDDMA